MKESLRQAPPLIMLMREVHVPLAVKGARNQRFVVPVGDLVFAVPAVSMNLPDSAEDCVFKVGAINAQVYNDSELASRTLCTSSAFDLQNARKFDPDRFKAPRNEDKARPFAYTAFGGGMHGCLGEQFGFLQARI